MSNQSHWVLHFDLINITNIMACLDYLVGLFFHNQFSECLFASSVWISPAFVCCLPNFEDISPWQIVNIVIIIVICIIFTTIVIYIVFIIIIIIIIICSYYRYTDFISAFFPWGLSLATTLYNAHYTTWNGLITSYSPGRRG